MNSQSKNPRCYNCKFSGPQFKIAGRTYMHCQNEELYPPADFKSGKLSPWDSLVEWWFSCKKHEWKKTGVDTLSAVRPITYVLIVSEFFPKTHPKAGLPTGFINAISLGNKKHTIRANYNLWKKRADRINKGEAVLSVRYWTGKPYNSRQCEAFVFEKIGLEKIQRDNFLGWFINDLDSDFETDDFAENDGLCVEDFKSWFKGKDFAEPKAIIHFGKFRYSR